MRIISIVADHNLTRVASHPWEMVGGGPTPYLSSLRFIGPPLERWVTTSPHPNSLEGGPPSPLYLLLVFCSSFSLLKSPTYTHFHKRPKPFMIVSGLDQSPQHLNDLHACPLPFESTLSNLFRKCNNVRQGFQIICFDWNFTKACLKTV